jgi:hypothetical protein
MGALFDDSKGSDTHSDSKISNGPSGQVDAVVRSKETVANS